MVELWKRGVAYKTAQCLTHFATPLPLIADADRAFLIRSLEAEPVFMPLRYGGDVLFAPYTGVNPVIEREQMRGVFFEQEELAYLADRLPRGQAIVDVGANTGNHTLFFSAIMKAKSVIPIEPLPRAANAVRAVVAKNSLRNVDLSCLGRAVGAEEGTMRPRCRRRAPGWAQRTSWRTVQGMCLSCRSTALSRAPSTSSRSTRRGWKCRYSQVRRELSQRSIPFSSLKLWTRGSGNSWVGSTGTAIASKGSFRTRRIAITF
jgi:hypothetical protein